MNLQKKSPIPNKKKQISKRIKYLSSIHPLAKIFISLTFIFPVFLSSNATPPAMFLMLTTITIFLFDDRIKVKNFIITILAMIPVALSIFILNIVYGKYTDSKLLAHVFGLPIYDKNLKLGLALGLRAFTLGVISISWVLIIDFNRVIKGAMQTLKLNPKIGYSIFTGINAIPFFRDEFNRVKTVKKIRLLKRPMILSVAINILTQAVRYSERASISMVSRALSSDRTFYRDEKLKQRDFKAIILFFLINTITTLLLIIYGYFKVGI